MSEFQRPPTAQEAVLIELRARILGGELPAGSALRQEDLAASLGVSRVPVREALRMLESEGHVVYAAHRGYRVAELSGADLEEIYALRAVIEDDLAARAMPAMTADDLAQIHAAYAVLADAESSAAWLRGTGGSAHRPAPKGRASADATSPGQASADATSPGQASADATSPGQAIPDATRTDRADPSPGRASGDPRPADRGGIAAANRAFHWAILRPTPRADRILTTLWDASDAYRARWFADPANVARGAHDHREILHAVEAGDTSRLVAALTAHRNAAVTALRTALPH